MGTQGATFHVKRDTRSKDAARERLDQAIATAVNAAQTRTVIHCHMDPEGWYPDNQAYVAARTAIAWCEQCPVMAECREWAHTKPVDRWSVVLGGEWWTSGHVTNAYPQRKSKQETGAA